MGLAEVFEHISEAKDQDILKFLNEGLKRVENVPVPTKDKIFRMSGLSDMCPREEYLAAVHNVERKKKWTAEQNTAMAFGTMFHDWIRHELLGPLGILYGQWKCARCESRVEREDGATRYRMPKEPCAKCKHDKWFFHEDEIIDPVRGISGHHDGVLYWNEEYYLLELKTANDWSFKGFMMKGTPEYYVDQAVGYQELFGFDKTLMIYQNKDTSKRHTAIIRQDKERVSRLFGKITAFRQALDGGPIPDRICENASCTRAKGCTLAKVCFQRG